MDLSQRKERFSLAYVQAIAAVGGFTIADTRPDVDKVDLTFALAGGQGTVRSPKLDVQLKCTERDDESANHLSYQLDVDTYRELRGDDRLVPIILVVLVVPGPTSNEWLLQSPDELVMKRCAYYLSLRDHPPKDNSATVTVRLPREQVFSVEALSAILDGIGRGERP